MPKIRIFPQFPGRAEGNEMILGEQGKARRVRNYSTERVNHQKNKNHGWGCAEDRKFDFFFHSFLYIFNYLLNFFPPHHHPRASNAAFSGGKPELLRGPNSCQETAGQEEKTRREKTRREGGRRERNLWKFRGRFVPTGTQR